MNKYALMNTFVIAASISDYICLAIAIAVLIGFIVALAKGWMDGFWAFIAVLCLGIAIGFAGYYILLIFWPGALRAIARL